MQEHGQCIVEIAHKAVLDSDHTIFHGSRKVDTALVIMETEHLFVNNTRKAWCSCVVAFVVYAMLI